MGPVAIVTSSAAASAIEGVGKALSLVPPGLAWVQLRDKSAGANQLRAAASLLLPIVRNASALLIVNGTVELAIACGADGVHLPEADASPNKIASARNVAGCRRERFIVGTSRHRGETARAALSLADYVFLGPIWPTTGKPVALGPEQLGAARPPAGDAGLLFAIGGIGTAERARTALRFGADGVAGIRAFCGVAITPIAKAVGPLAPRNRSVPL